MVNEVNVIERSQEKRYKQSFVWACDKKNVLIADKKWIKWKHWANKGSENVEKLKFGLEKFDNLIEITQELCQKTYNLK